MLGSTVLKCFNYPHIYIVFIHQLYMTDSTTINILKEVKGLIKSKKIYDRETYNEVLKRELKPKSIKQLKDEIARMGRK